MEETNIIEKSRLQTVYVTDELMKISKCKSSKKPTNSIVMDGN
jgi:hypothetical protein